MCLFLQEVWHVTTTLNESAMPACGTPRLAVRSGRSPTSNLAWVRERSGYAAQVAKWCSTMDAATATFRLAVPGPCCGMYTSVWHAASSLADNPEPCHKQ